MTCFWLSSVKVFHADLLYSAKSTEQVSKKNSHISPVCLEMGEFH